MYTEKVAAVMTHGAAASIAVLHLAKKRCSFLLHALFARNSADGYYVGFWELHATVGKKFAQIYFSSPP